MIRKHNILLKIVSRDLIKGGLGAEGQHNSPTVTQGLLLLFEKFYSVNRESK